MDLKYRRKIEALYIQMHGPLLEYARSSLSGDSLAEEAVQETFRIACQKPDALCSSENPQGWLVNTLKYVISNTKRNVAATRLLLDDYASARISQIAAPDDGPRIELLYGDIAETEEFLLLKEMAVEGKSHLEMARSRGISIAACRKRVQRAKETLRNKIKK